jgi:PIN like domain
MNILYIDTNIYLGFYNSNRPEYKKLLNSIIELSDNIFFTEQLAIEINRNKLNVFQQSSDKYIKQMSIISTLLPEHLDNDGSPKLKEWNKDRKEIEKIIKASNKSLLPIINELLLNISKSEDIVSKKLHVLYDKIQKPNNDDLNNARLRRELGNPPGKRSDSLGDQLTWEQLLSISSEIENLWIVSTDRDYFTESKKEIYLNPVLYNDLKKINKDINIKVFNILSEALRDFNTQEKIKSIPSPEELDIISDSEVKDLTRITGSTTSNIYSNFSISSKPNLCPNCSQSNTFLDGAYLRSRYGGLTLQYICKNCGFHFDTGEFFD